MSYLHKIGSIACLVAVAVFSLNGCATIFKGGKQTIGFGSNPAGAEVYINGQFKGNTPLNIKLKVNKSYSIEFRRDGYETRVVNISKTLGAGWIVLDIVTGFWPIFVDAITGSWYSLDQDHVNAVLKKQNQD